MSTQTPFLMGMFLMGIAIIFLLWMVPQRQLRKVTDLTPSDRVDLEIKARAVLAQSVGGLVLLFGLYITWSSLDLSRRAQWSDRFAKATETLGNSAAGIPAHIGAIAALEQLARESETYRWPIMETLAAYVRQESPWQPRLPKDQNLCRQRAALMKGESAEPRAREDIQAALGVLKQQDWAQSPYPLNLKGVDLRGADLDDGDLRCALFSDSYLGGARLNDADLYGAHFLNTCIAEYTQCAGAKTDRTIATGAILDGLSDCKLGGNKEPPDPRHCR
jgi:hypothetical protein